MSRTIFDDIIVYMNKAETLNDMSGQQRREYVLNRMRNKLGKERYIVHHGTIESIIEGVIDIKSHPSMIAVNHHRRRFHSVRKTFGKIWGCQK